MGKLASGQWTLVDQSDYLRPPKGDVIPGTGWFIIRTQPAPPNDPHLAALEHERQWVYIVVNR